MNNKPSGEQEREIAELEKERRSALRGLKKLARQPEYNDDEKTKEWTEHINKRFDKRRKLIEEKYPHKHIELNDSDCDSDIDDDIPVDSNKHKGLHIESNSSDSDDAIRVSNNSKGLLDGSDDDSSVDSSSSTSCSDDPVIAMDDDVEVVENDKETDYDLVWSKVPEKEREKIRTSKLTMAIQGFQSIQHGDLANATQKEAAGPSVTFDPESVKFEGRRFYKGTCYRYVERVGRNKVDIIVGIRKFLAPTKAETVLIVPFEDTRLGLEEEGDHYKADFKPSSHCQVVGHVRDLHLKNVKEPAPDIKGIPKWAYEPEREDKYNRFGYFLPDNLNSINRKGRREELRVLELFVGCGGMHLGFRMAGFTTVDTVDMDLHAIASLKKNCPGVPTFRGDIHDYLAQHQDPQIRKLQGRVDCIVVTAPCQGFSGANRRGGKNDKANNNLSLTLLEAVRLYQPDAVVFENVLGIWNEKHIHYLKNIAKELIKLGYQVRIKELRACDYGTAQIRPRIILIATHVSAPPPRFPQKSHGDGEGLLPMVTVQDALAGLEDGLDSFGNPFRNTGGKTKLQEGQHGLVKLKADGLAPAIRTSSIPLHYALDRYINVRECLTLQDFPSTFEVLGTLTQQYRQVGNAVPVQLATAIALALRELLAYHYERKPNE